MVHTTSSGDSEQKREELLPDRPSDTPRKGGGQRLDDAAAHPTPQNWGRYHLTPEIARLPGTVLKVTLALAEYGSPRQPWAWPKVASLAERLGIPAWKVREWLDKAEGAGVLRRCKRRYPHASLAYDLRPWFAAMGYPEALTVAPPAKQRIVTAQENPALNTAEKLRTVARRETLRGSARRNPALSSEPTMEPTIQNQIRPKARPDSENESLVGGNGDGTSNGHRTARKPTHPHASWPDMVEALKQATGFLRVTPDTFWREVNRRPDVDAPAVKALVGRVLDETSWGRALQNPDGYFTKAMRKERHTPLGPGGLTAEAQAQADEMLAATSARRDSGRRELTGTGTLDSTGRVNW